MKVAIECVEGIILNDVNYSESSKILNILTKEYGLIGVMSKGCRNMKSKLRGSSRKLIHAKFHIYYKVNGLCTLIGIDLINSYANILNNLSSISYATYLLELTEQVVRQSESNDVFFLLKNGLDKINEGFSPLVITDILELKYLDYLGVCLNIDGCSLCGSNKNILTISSEAGGYLCSNCYTNGYIVEDITIKLIRMFFYVDLAKISKLDIEDSELREVNYFLEEYYEKYTGLYLKSKKVLAKITNFVES